MSDTTKNKLVDRCFSYIEVQKSMADQVSEKSRKKDLPAVTISRLAGARATAIAPKLAEYLMECDDAKTKIPWAFFDKNLVKQVLEDHQLPEHLENLISEDKMNPVEDLISEIFGQNPSSWELFQKTSETIYRLAKMGHSILVGRGGVFIAKDLPNVLHVRLIGSQARRIAYVKQLHNLKTDKETEDWIHKTDRNRRRYLQAHFDQDPDNPLHYHLTLNTDYFSDDAAVEIIAKAIEQHNRDYLAPGGLRTPDPLLRHRVL